MVEQCDEREECGRQRLEILREFEEWLETPMVVLGFVWLVLLVLELTRGLSAGLEWLGTAIWILFVVDFAVRLLLATRKLDYLRSNVVTAIALVLPAFRVLRIFRVLRFARGLRLVRVLTSVNRGMRALRRTMQRRALGYILSLSVIVAFAGAAGMVAFERESGGDFRSYPSALWWTAMMLTTMGSESWPKTPEGRVLCLLLSIYSFTVFGYVTASLASFFVGRDADAQDGEVAGAKQIESLREEISALRAELRAGS